MTYSGNREIVNFSNSDSVFRTTSNLQGTTLTGSLSDSAIGAQNIFTDTTGFPSSGYIYINSEYIQYDSVDSSTQLTLTTGGRGSFGSIAQSHVSTDIVGEVYNSGILTLDGYTQVQTKILSSNTGQMKFQWYSDGSGSDVVRTLNPPYNTINNYDFLSAPNFAPYVRYLFANTQSSVTTDFYFETEFLNTPISAQVLTLNSSVLGGMTANLGRNILVGTDKSNSYKNVPVDSEGHIMCHIHDPVSAFGQLKVAEETTIIQISFPYQISDKKVTRQSLFCNEATTGGSGSSLTVDYGCSSGAIQFLYPKSRGSSYVVGDTITVSNGTGGTADVESINSSGGVLALSLQSAGSGYTDPSLVTNLVTQENNMIKLTTEASANRRTMVRTKRKAKYQTGTGIISRFTAIFETGTANSNQYVGIGDENNGFFVGYQGTDFGILQRQNGTETFTTQSNFNVDLLDGSGTNNPSNINGNFQTGNVFQIKYQWLGFGAITYYIEDENEGDFEPFHIIRYANNNTIPSLFLPTLPMYWEIENTTNTSSLSLFSASAMASVEGKIIYEGDKFSTNRASGNFTYLFSIRNKTYFKSQINHIETIIQSLTIGNDANSARTYTLTLNGDLTGSPVWNDVDSIDSCTEEDFSATAVTNGSIIKTFSLAKDSSLNIDIKPGEIILQPGDILSLVASLGTTQSASINWLEYE